ncbi:MULTISPECIES: TetR/AcrR family transcriptional regulator [Mycolicibacterium]|uniref:TetR/AcrR family transcriptional regulator n=1 Tax=Mycolicibacterium monacense TaxID=85693 RepID=UPI0007EC1AF6|nr:TetR/AcrR family transcriptional regulator [Mycolicibacterium monacense]OBB56230.1 TetR family transcriptional regulator [Mycolicibacterium monacense]OBF56471.1 TetR family transcriptional regulator [Mycolicibacterium monacense]
MYRSVVNEYHAGMARPRKFDEAEVVEASRDLFWDQGYAATSIDDLSAATGLGRGSFYKAFGDKHSMFLRSLELYCTEALDGIRAELRNPDLSAYDRLVGHVRGTAAGVASDTDRRGCLLAKSAAELSATDPAVAKLVKRTLDGWLRELTATIVAAQTDGDVPADTDAKAMASLLLVVLRGMEALRKGGASATTVKLAAEQAIAMLAVPAPVAG